jgi:hypothetical protein
LTLRIPTFHPDFKPYGNRFKKVGSRYNHCTNAHPQCGTTGM